MERIAVNEQDCSLLFSYLEIPAGECIGIRSLTAKLQRLAV